MKIEHIGICVKAPVSMGAWYRDHLGLEILLTMGNDEDGVSFISDGSTVIEIARLPEGQPLQPEEMQPLQLHLAFDCADPVAEATRLVEAGAEWIGESARNAYKNEKVLLRDPWGYTIQLLNREEKLGDSGKKRLTNK